MLDAPRRVSLPMAPRATPRAVRLSITDRCDLACVYCRPSRHDGYLPPNRRLDPKAWATLVRGLVDNGVRRVRITGGEPLVHPAAIEVIAAIAEVPGVEDLALTTNCTRLAELAIPLLRAGLRRINVSVDSLDPARFHAITRGGSLVSTLRAIDAALEAGFEEIKSNTVVLGGDGTPGDLLRNDDELEAFVAWGWARGITPRFIELMPIGEGARLRHRFVPYEAMRARLAPLLDCSSPSQTPDRGPARYVSARGGSARRVGFITGTSETFCDGCDRLRVSSDGALRPCLATSDCVDAGAAARAGDQAAIGAALDDAWQQKPGTAWRGCTEPSALAVSMRSTGG